MTRTEAAACYEKAIATQPGVERKGASILYTSLNGHMFSMFTKDGRMALRLPEPERDAFLKKYKTILCEQYGIVQREYVIVPESLLAKTTELGKHVAVSHAYVKSLKPKPTTKKGASGRGAKKGQRA